MTRRGDAYTLTYDDTDLPAHYGWKVASRLDAIEAQYRTLREDLRASLPASPPEALEPRVREILRGLDDQGRWVSTYRGEQLVGQPKFPPNRRYLASEVFSRNLEVLSAYLKALTQD
jgi:hypothetical protein